MSKKTLLAFTMLASTAALAAPVNQSGDFREMNVSATVLAACSDLTVGDLDFGSVPAQDDFVDQTVDIMVTCGNGINYSIELDYGINPAGTERRMESSTPGEFVAYTVYQPDPSGAASTTTEWGAASAGQAYAQTGTGSPQALTATGRLDLQATTVPGDYSDLVVVTINF